MPHTTTEYLRLAPAPVVAQVQRLEHVGDQARDVVDHAECDEHERHGAEDPEERAEPRADDVLAVIHCAALPEPTRNPPAVVFRNNKMATFNVAEAAVRMGVDRVVNVSSETVTGMALAERRFHAGAAPIDESTPSRPQDPYALAKAFGEQLMDALVARSDVSAVSIRPSWVQWEGNYERSLRPWVSDPLGGAPSESFWSYIDIYDLAHALRLAAECSLSGHEAMYIVSADNGAGRPLKELIAHHFGEAVSVGPLPREDAGGISFAKAERMIGYRPAHTWRDYLGEDGLLLDAPRERLARGETAVQPGRAALLGG